MTSDRTTQHYTIPVNLTGYERLTVTVNLGMTAEQIDAQRARGNQAPAIVDFPNWDDEAASCGMTALDPATGELNGHALEKPEFPLTIEVLRRLPERFVLYLTTDDALSDALLDERETRRPFLRRR